VDSASPPKDGFAAANKIASWVIEHTSNGQRAEFFVVLADQAELSGAASLPTKAEKGRFVHQTLLEKAQSSQQPLLQWLRDRNVEHRSFYIVNAILVKGDRQIAEALAARPDVARVTGNPDIHNDLPQPGPVEVSPSAPRAPATIEPGIAYTHAPDVWALGFRGETVVVASADTGVRWTHNALKPHYRGWNGVTADHNYNWWDAIHSGGGVCGPNNQAPCDDSGHGTHTTGTTSGDDGTGNQIGVAPGAKWIGCRNMDQGNGMPSTYTECFQFFIAPTDLNGQNPNPALRPHVINDSWTCPVSEGCTTGDELRVIVENTQAAGIFVEPLVPVRNSSGGARNPPSSSKRFAPPTV
jgi:subtilisin family serine protease